MKIKVLVLIALLPSCIASTFPSAKGGMSIPKRQNGLHKKPNGKLHNGEKRIKRRKKKQTEPATYAEEEFSKRFVACQKKHTERNPLRSDISGLSQEVQAAVTTFVTSADLFQVFDDQKFIPAKLANYAEHIAHKLTEKYAYVLQARYSAIEELKDVITVDFIKTVHDPILAAFLIAAVSFSPKQLAVNSGTSLCYGDSATERDYAASLENLAIRESLELCVGQADSFLERLNIDLNGKTAFKLHLYNLFEEFDNEILGGLRTGKLPHIKHINPNQSAEEIAHEIDDLIKYVDETEKATQVYFPAVIGTIIRVAEDLEQRDELEKLKNSKFLSAYNRFCAAAFSIVTHGKNKKREPLIAGLLDRHYLTTLKYDWSSHRESNLEQLDRMMNTA